MLLEPLALFMFLIFWFPNHLKPIAFVCRRQDRVLLSHVLYLITLNEVRMQSLSIFNIPPFDRSFLLVHTVFVEDINYESYIVMCYPRKTLTSKIMPIQARIF